MTVTNVTTMKKSPIVKKLLRMREDSGKDNSTGLRTLGQWVDLTTDVIREQGVIIVMKTQKVGKK